MLKRKITVVTDSSSYLPKRMLDTLDIAVIPLWLIWDEESLLDGIDIDPFVFYNRLRASKTMPTSSQPTVPEFVEFYLKVAEKTDVIVNVLVSAKISGTVENALKAIQKLPDLEIHLIDSYSSSMGLGHVVLAAARSAAEGGSVDDVVRAADGMRQKINFIFVVDTLEYLHKGGRIGGAKRLLGTALSVKPLLEFRDGQIEPLEQVRTHRKAIARMLEIAEERLAGRQMAEATIVDVDCPKEGDRIAEEVMARFSLPQVHRSGVSPVVGTHVGPGAIGFAFYAQD